MTVDPTFAPGCFGSALGFKDTAIECQNCVFAAQCQPRQEHALALLRERYGVKAPGAKSKAPAKTQPNGAYIENRLPDRVQSLLDKIETSGLRVTEAIREGRNPFPVTDAAMKALSAITHMGLRMSLAGLSLDQASVQIARGLGCGDKVAHSLTGDAFQALKALGAADVEENILKLRRS